MIKRYLSILLLLISSIFLFGYTANGDDGYTDIRDLPETSGSYTTQLMKQPGAVAPVNFERRELTKNDGTKAYYYYLTIEHENGVTYKSKTNLPFEDTADNFKGYYYTEKDDRGKTNRFIYYDIKPEKYTESYLVNEVSMINYDTQVNPFGRVIWNVTTGTFNLIDQITIFGAYRITTVGTRKAYFLDFVMSVPTDSVKMVHLNYNHRNIYWFGHRGKWFNETFVYRDTDYLKGFDSSGRPITTTDKYDIADLRREYEQAIYNSYAYSYDDLEAYNNFTELQPMIDIQANPQSAGLDSYNAIQFQTDFINRLNNQARNEYELAVQDTQNWKGIEHMNEAVKRWFLHGNFNFNDVFSQSTDGKIYTLPLQAVRDWLTAKGKEFKDMNFVDVIFEQNGKFYHASESQIISVVPGLVDDPPLSQKIKDWFKSVFDKIRDFLHRYRWAIAAVVIVVVAVIVTYLFGPVIRTFSSKAAQAINSKSKSKKKSNKPKVRRKKK